MKREVITTILKMFAKALFFTAVAAIIIAFLGYRNHWQDPVAYSNAFFIAGCFLIVAGGVSKLVSGQEWGAYQRINSAGLSHMSSGERSKFIVEVSSSFNLALLGFLSGIMLFIISYIFMKMP